MGVFNSNTSLKMAANYMKMRLTNQIDLIADNSFVRYEWMNGCTMDGWMYNGLIPLQSLSYINNFSHTVAPWD